MFVPLTPLRCLDRALDLFASRVGVVCGQRVFTYTQFGERCGKLASGLTRLGVEPGDRVAYLSFNTHKLLEGYYGVVQARGIVMPLNVRLSAEELTAIVEHSGARVLMFERDFAPTVERLRSWCPSVRRWVGLDGPEPPADLSYEEILDQGRPERADIFSYDETSTAELFYTSGSTGTPKGVALSHRTVYLHAVDIMCMYRDFETMVDLHTIPLFHANGWGRPQTSTMLGTRQVMVRRFEPGAVLRLIQEHRATDMCLVPVMANALVNAPDRAQFDTSSLRRVMIGGAANSAELVARVEAAFPSCECISGYGLTETTPVVTVSQTKREAEAYGEDRCRRQAMTGATIPGAWVRVVDSQMRDVPRDMHTMGEVVAMGDHIMDGYYREPEATAAAMSGPWLHTGDMAVWGDDAYIQIVDRKKEIIISGGENISSIEIEKAVFAHPAVLECAVVAAPDDRWGEVPAAVVVRKPGMDLSADELLAFLEGRLARYKLPRRIEFSPDALPKTGTGKIRKLDLREKFWTGKSKRVQG
jgi:fatty-acyl-CoA synthase